MSGEEEALKVTPRPSPQPATPTVSGICDSKNAIGTYSDLAKYEIWKDMDRLSALLFTLCCYTVLIITLIKKCNEKGPFTNCNCTPRLGRAGPERECTSLRASIRFIRAKALMISTKFQSRALKSRNPGRRSYVFRILFLLSYRSLRARKPGSRPLCGCCRCRSRCSWCRPRKTSSGRERCIVLSYTLSKYIGWFDLLIVDLFHWPLNDRFFLLLTVLVN